MELATEGIVRLSKMGDLAQALENLGESLSAALQGGDTDAGSVVKGRRDESLGRVDETVRLAQAEIDEGFPWLFPHMVVACWAGLETFIDEIAVGALERDQQLKFEEPFVRIKAPVVIYEGLSPSERAEFLAGEVTRNTGADLKRGVGRFEAVLSAVRLGGAVDKTTSDCLFELSQCRNLVVHRANVTERQFCESCPRFGLAVGDVLTIPFSLAGWYFQGAVAYAITVRNRAANQMGGSVLPSDFWPAERPTQ